MLISESTKVAASSEARLEDDVRAIEAINAEIGRMNAPVIAYLETISGRSIGSQPEAWRAWWVDSMGYAYHRESVPDKPTMVQTMVSRKSPSTTKGWAPNAVSP